MSGPNAPGNLEPHPQAGSQALAPVAFVQLPDAFIERHSQPPPNNIGSWLSRASPVLHMDLPARR